MADLSVNQTSSVPTLDDLLESIGGDAYLCAIGELARDHAMQSIQGAVKVARAKADDLRVEMNNLRAAVNVAIGEYRRPTDIFCSCGAAAGNPHRLMCKQQISDDLDLIARAALTDGSRSQEPLNQSAKQEEK